MGKKPDAIKHMTLYGLVYGLLLAMLYMWGFLLFSGGEVVDFFSILGSMYLGTIFGAIPGAIMGFFEGIIIWAMVRDLDMPLDQEKFAYRARTSYKIVGLLTGLGMTSILGFMFGIDFFIFWPLLLPIMISVAASVYAARRYMLKIQAWGTVPEKRKSKAKHESSLSEDEPQQSDEHFPAEQEKNNLQNLFR